MMLSKKPLYQSRRTLHIVTNGALFKVSTKDMVTREGRRGRGLCEGRGRWRSVGRSVGGDTRWAHLMISCSRCSSWRCRIITPSMMARSSGVRCDRSGMSAMAGGGEPRAVRGPAACCGAQPAARYFARHSARRFTQ